MCNTTQSPCLLKPHDSCTEFAMLVWQHAHDFGVQMFMWQCLQSQWSHKIYSQLRSGIKINTSETLQGLRSIVKPALGLVHSVLLLLFSAPCLDSCRWLNVLGGFFGGGMWCCSGGWVGVSGTSISPLLPSSYCKSHSTPLGLIPAIINVN